MNAKYNTELCSIIEQKNKEWIDNVKSIAPLLRSAPENMVEANALALSYRAMILEEIGYFTGLMAQHERQMKEIKRDKFIYYATGTLPDGTRPLGKAANHPLLGKKLTKSEYDIVISGDLNEQEFTLQVISDVVQQFREYIKTIDSMVYSIKNRLDLFNYLK